MEQFAVSHNHSSWGWDDLAKGIHVMHCHFITGMHPGKHGTVGKAKASSYKKKQNKPHKKNMWTLEQLQFLGKIWHDEGLVS